MRKIITTYSPDAPKAYAWFASWDDYDGDLGWIDHDTAMGSSEHDACIELIKITDDLL